jgi:tetratricopeptide (TPR) repeat protein
MAHHRLLVSHDGASICLGWQRGDGAPRFAPTVVFEHPFDAKALAELRWYLEEYLTFPYGLEPERAARLEGQLQGWGQQLFELVFRGSEKAREFWQEATRAGLDQCELGIVSDDAAVLNLPWELLYAPDYQFLAPLLAGMYRSRSNQPVRAPLEGLPQDRLNILVVIARPYGERDVALRTIARPMLEALRPLGERVHLKVLRPPSFEQFERELNEHKGFYHIVHFDGHGSFDPSSVGRQVQMGQGIGQGQLVFEGVDGSPQVIDAARIAQNLTNCRVPIFVLNACQSAQEGEGAFSSVATALVSVGATGVVAMAYSVYVEAARQFMGRFYGDLTRGATVAGAVASGRRAVLNQQLRPSPKGDLPLQDWLVPVLYQQEGYTPLPARQETPSFETLLTQAQRVGTGVATMDPSETGVLPPSGTYGFIGRDYELMRLERAFRRSSVVLLKGMGGVGKTELAVGFARWLQETQGCTGGIFFTSFETGQGLSAVVNAIGRRLGGANFDPLMPEQQEALVVQYLQANPCLLIWDNFEPVAGFPAGNEPLLSETERRRLTLFLKTLRQGKSWVLMTSRRTESWLDCGYELVELRGLSKLDAAELAAQILQMVGVERSKLSGEYLKLLSLLGGHPLSLRVVLPHLKTQTPEHLIESLRLGLDTFAGGEEQGRETSLTVSLDYSFKCLSARTRQHLPFLALFAERVDTDCLGYFADDAKSAFGQAYQAVFGEMMSKADWQILLQEATAAGILDYLGATYYQIHPALPWYLRQRLEALTPKDSILLAELEAQLLNFYATLANHHGQQLVSNAEQASEVLWAEEPNLLQQLRLAEQQQQWSATQAILQVLGAVYERWGRKPERNLLQQRILKQIGLNLREAKTNGKAAFDLWMYIRGNDASDALQAANLEGARSIYQEILDELLALNTSEVNRKVAVAYHQLGRVAEGQHRFDDAIAFYRKALKIYEDAGDFYRAASEYHQLGMVAQEQRHFDDAINFYQEALKIHEYAGDFYNAAPQYHQLGMVASEQRRFDDAITFYQKALKIHEDAGDFYRAATGYSQLGIVAQKQRRFDDAITFYQKALKIHEDAGNFYRAASEYHQLGMVASEQCRFDDAIAFYQKALKTHEDAGDFYSAASEYHQLGIVAQYQCRFDDAITFYQKALKILEDAGDFYHAASEYYQLGIVAQYQCRFDNAMFFYIKALGIFLEAKDEYKAEAPMRQLGELLAQLGETQFKSLWQEITGEACPEQ